MFRTRACSGWRRLKASNWWVSAPPRSAERRISSSALALRLLQVAARQQQIAVAGDHGQQIVEIVRHAAGQPAHRLHLLRLPELLLQPDAVAAHPGAAQFAFHRGVEAHQVAARQMVGRAGFENGEHIRILDLARNHDQRQIERLFLNHPQSFQRAEAGAHAKSLIAISEFDARAVSSSARLVAHSIAGAIVAALQFVNDRIRSALADKQQLRD